MRSGWGNVGYGLITHSIVCDRRCLLNHVIDNFFLSKHDWLSYHMTTNIYAVINEYTVTLSFPWLIALFSCLIRICYHEVSLFSKRIVEASLTLVSLPFIYIMLQFFRYSSLQISIVCTSNVRVWWNLRWKPTVLIRVKGSRITWAVHHMPSYII